MVTTSSGKIVKYTYTERVLHAFSQVLKKHRRHAVHMTSLRAQVRKNAEANRDKLGPRWPNWVTKTVHRLEDEGILAPARSSSGSVVMTPDGKKAIATVRKSLAAATNTSPTSVDQELLWKAIAHQSPTKSSAAGVKRRRHSTVQPRNEDSEVQTSPARRNAKRARTSLPTVKKTLSKMTKAELQAAVRNLEAENTDILMRPMSPLTDLDEGEERERLEAELVARDEEIRRVRQQLDELKSQTTPVRSSELDSSQTTRPEATRDVSPSPEQRPTGGVVRTQSGSLICDVSKRPTPAPSSPGVDGGLTLAEEDDLFGDSGEPVSPRTQLFGPVQPNAAAEEAKRAQEEMERAYRNKISILEEALESRVREIQEQKQAREKLSEQIPRLEVEFADRVSTLEQEIETLCVKLSSVSSDLVSKNTELEHLRTSKDAVESSLKGLEEESSRVKADLENARLELASAQDQNTSLAALHMTAEATLATRDEEAAELSRQLQELLVECKSLEEQLATELYKNAVFEVTLNESNASRDAKMTELASSWEENEGLRVNISNLELSVTQAKADIDRLTQNLEQSKASEDAWRNALSRAEESHEKLAASLSAEVKQLQNILSEVESRAVINEGKSAELENAVGGLHTELANAQEKIKEVESNLAVVQAQQSAERKSHESTVAEMKESLSTKRQEMDRLSAELKSARFERRRVQEDLVMRQKEFSDATNALKTELAATVSRADGAEEGLSVLYKAKEADEATIEALKETFTQLRDAQLRSFEELGNKIHSAGSTPASKSHLTRMDL
ncbi:hypothetical protein JOM56_000686 [Amanita muscaria]